jgi:hypothetical protein
MHRRFLVIESDKLSWKDQCAVINYVRQFAKLRMVLGTGSRSLHGWFDMPPPEALEQLEIILPELDVDQACFTPSQPFRMPMVCHQKTGRLSMLAYFDGGAR